MNCEFEEVNAPDNFRRMGYELIDLLAEELERSNNSVEEQSTINWESPEDQLAFWKSDFHSPNIKEPISLFREIIKHSINVNRRGNVGHQISVPYPVTTLASALIAHLNNGMGVYEVGMAGNAMEKIIIGELAGFFGLPGDASGFITSGGSLGNLTALLTAKNKYMQEHPDHPLDQLAVLVSQEAHYSIERTISTIGIPKENLIKIPVDSDFRIQDKLLARFYDEARNTEKKVFCIIGCSCATSTGSFDNLLAISEFAKKHNLWFHVDAAHGGPAIFSKQYNHLLNGIEHADSIIMDFHKMMAVPSLSTVLMFRHNWYSKFTFSQNAQYLWRDQQSEEWYNSGKRTFECTKPMTVLHIYTILRIYGYKIYQKHVELLYGLANRFALYLKSRAAFEVLCTPQSNIVCFRYVATETDVNPLNEEIQKKIVRDGTFYLVGTTASGQYYLRISLMNTRTTMDDLIKLADTVVLKANEITAQKNGK